MVVASGAFDVVVIDFDAVPLAEGATSTKAVGKKSPEVLVRKLALAAESNGATVLLLTDASRLRALPWPVALRLELSRPNARELSVSVVKSSRIEPRAAETIAASTSRVVPCTRRCTPPASVISVSDTVTAEREPAHGFDPEGDAARAIFSRRSALSNLRCRSSMRGVAPTPRLYCLARMSARRSR